MAAKESYENNEKQLWSSIKNKDIGCLYLFYGPEEYLKRNYTEQIDKALVSEEFALMNRVVLEGKITPSAIIDNCETLPLFSDRRVVIVKNSGLFKGAKKTRGKDGSTSEIGSAKRKGDELADFLNAVPTHVCLIFLETEIDKRIKYVDLVKSNGLIVEFDYKKPDELTKWVMRRIAELGYEVNPRTAAMIVEYCEVTMDDILNEIIKLCAYAGDRRRIEESDVEKVCIKSVKSRVFDLTDAIGAKQTAKALMLLSDMEVLKEPMPKVMYMISRQFRQLVQVKLMLEDGASQAQIATHLKLHPYVAGKLIKQAKSFSREKLEQAISTGLELDLAIKTGRLDNKTAVELMIIGLSA